MVNTNPDQRWNDEELPPYLSRKQAETDEIYELVPANSSKFFSRIGKITVFVGLLVGLFFLGRYIFLKVATPSETEADVSTVSGSEQAMAQQAPVVKPAQRKAPEVGYVAAWSIDASKATISWSTDVPASTMLLYGTTKALEDQTIEDKKLNVTHGITLSNLKAGTTYYYVASSTDKNGISGRSSEYSFTTKSVPVPPAISDIEVEPDTKNELTISWKTSKPAYSYFSVGTATAYEHWSNKTELTTSARCVVKWVPSGTVKYQLVSIDADGNKNISPEYTFVQP